MKLRVAAFDIETTALDGTYGRLLCACFQFGDESKPRTIRCHSLAEERRALRELARNFNDVDILLTWNGIMFDIPLINARLLRHRMPPLPQVFHVDLMWQHKKLRTRGHRLEGAIKDLNIATKKFDVTGERWQQAADTGHPHSKLAFESIVRHCQHDVRATLEVGERLKPLLRNIYKR